MLGDETELEWAASRYAYEQGVGFLRDHPLGPEDIKAAYLRGYADGQAERTPTGAPWSTDLNLAPQGVFVDVTARTTDGRRIVTIAVQDYESRWHCPDDDQSLGGHSEKVIEAWALRRVPYAQEDG